jgi:hypothetical protein
MTMTVTERQAMDKFRSVDLREDALQSASLTQTVLVEVGVPLPKVSLSTRSGITPGRPMFKVSSGSQTESVDDVRRELEEALGHKTERYLPSSRTFVVEATGQELLQIAQVPSVVAIWPNTERGLVEL